MLQSCRRVSSMTLCNRERQQVSNRGAQTLEQPVTVHICLCVFAMFCLYLETVYICPVEGDEEVEQFKSATDSCSQIPKVG